MNRKEWIFEDEDNQNQVEDRIEEALEEIIGYNVFALVERTVQVKIGTRHKEKWQSENKEISLYTDDLRAFSFIPKTVLQETPDDCSRFFLIPKEEIWLTAKLSQKNFLLDVSLRLLFCFSDYFSWDSEKHEVLWSIQAQYQPDDSNDKTFIFELPDCRLKVL